MSENDNSAPVKIAAVDKLRAARAQVARWKKVEEDAKAEIRAMLKGKAEGTVRGDVVVRVTETKANVFDTKAFREAEPEMAALYTKLQPRSSMLLVEVDSDGDGGDE